MRIARIATSTGPRHAVERGDRWHLVVDPFHSPLEETGETLPSEGAVLLAPVVPRVVVGIGHNLGVNDHPLPIQAWLKSVHTVVGPDDEIHAARDVGTVNIEGELGVVIARSATALTVENAFDHVLGYTVVNDVTNISQVPIDERNFQAKSGVGYTPVGPWIETDLADPENVATEVVINGRSRASSGSFNLASSVAATLVYVTRWLTLEPGDLVMTGAPGTFVPVEVGDLVAITLDGVGTLTNRVV